MTIYDILDLFSRYKPEYNALDKIIIIRMAIPVKDFCTLRAYLDMCSEKIEIRITNSQSEEMKNYYGGIL